MKTVFILVPNASSMKRSSGPMISIRPSADIARANDPPVAPSARMYENVVKIATAINRARGITLISLSQISLVVPPSAMWRKAQTTMGSAAMPSARPAVRPQSSDSVVRQNATMMKGAITAR